MGATKLMMFFMKGKLLNRRASQIVAIHFFLIIIYLNCERVAETKLLDAHVESSNLCSVHY